MHQKGGGWGDPLVQWQCMGALFVFVAWGLWTARRHLKAVFRKAWNDDPDVDDADELLSYRTAVIGLIVGIVYIIAWLLKAGVAPGLLMITIPAAIVIYLALARFVCESGTLYLGIPTTPLDMGFQLIGTVTIDPRTIAVGSTAHALRWMLFMPALSQCAKVFDRVPGNKRALFWVLLLGLGGALVVNISMVLYLGYTHGAYNFTEYPFTRYAPRLYDAVVNNIKSPEPASWERVVLFGLGGPHFCDSHCSSVSPALVAYPSRGFYLLRRPVSSTKSRLSLSSGCSKPSSPGWAVYLSTRSTVRSFFGIIAGRATGVLISFVVDLIWFPGGGQWGTRLGVILIDAFAELTKNFNVKIGFDILILCLCFSYKIDILPVRRYKI